VRKTVDRIGLEEMRTKFGWRAWRNETTQ